MPISYCLQIFEDRSTVKKNVAMTKHMAQNTHYLRRSKMKRKKNRKFVCLYHRTETDKVSVEDILQKAFGGKKTSSTLICADCNNELGRSIDKKFAESLVFVTSIVNPPSRRKPAATLKNVSDVNGEKWHIGPGGQPTMPYSALGPTSWKADAADLDMAEKNAKEKAKSLGLDPTAINITHHTMQAAPIPFSLELENEIAFRSACKTMFEYLALVGFDENDRKSELLLNVRNFITSGGQAPDLGWLESSLVTNSFENLDHTLLLIQSEDLSVYWEFILYGGIVGICGRFSPITQKIQNYMYRVCTTTGEAHETNPDELEVGVGYHNWFPDTTAKVQERTNMHLTKLNIKANVNSDRATDKVEAMSIQSPDEYMKAGAALILEQGVEILAKMTGADPTVIRQQVIAKLAADGEIDTSIFDGRFEET